VLQIQQTTVGLAKWHEAGIYFPPVHMQSSASCLAMNFTTASYFAVKLSYAVNNIYKEKLLFRSLSSLDTDFVQWHKSITPTLTEASEFVLSIHTRGADKAVLATIKSFQLIPEDCDSAGAYEHKVNFIRFLRCFLVYIKQDLPFTKTKSIRLRLTSKILADNECLN
jgi:hypothetical protein